MSAPSLYTAVPVKAVGDRQVLALAWNQSKETPLLAVSVESMAVMVLAADGSHFEEAVIKTRDGKAKALHLEWSPPTTADGKLLAIGWDDGTVMVWSLTDRIGREESEQHGPHPLAFVHWSPDAERLISADARPAGNTPQEAAVLAVWKCDSKGRPSVICPYRRPAVGAYSHAVFRTQGRAKKMVTSAFAAAECPPFYCGGELGVICCGNDMGSCGDVISGLGAGIAAMLYDPGSDQLFVITKANMLAQFKMNDNKPAQVSKVKLSMGKEGLHAAIWAGPAQLAIASADHVVRVNDQAGDSNYALLLPDVDHSLNGHKIVSLAQEQGRGTLAAGTRDGSAVVWRPTPGAQADAPELGWEPLAPVWLPSGCVELKWGPQEGLLAARLCKGVCVLPETVLRRVMDGEWAAVQLSASALRLEHTGGATYTLEAKMRICGCAIHAGHVAIWSGAQLQVYRFDEQGGLGEVELVAGFECRSRAVALWRDALYVCAGERVEVTRFQGTVTSSVSLPKAEGEPAVVTVSGTEAAAWLAVGTDRGFVRAWDISRREPRQHALGKRLVAEAAAAAARVSSVQVAADGSRVSATVETQPHANAHADAGVTGVLSRAGKPAAKTAWVRSAAVYVYVVESDVVQVYDFGPVGRLPCAHLWDPLEPRMLAVESRADQSAGKSNNAVEVTTIFSTADSGLKVKDSFTADEELESLIAVQVPRFYFATHAPAAAASADGSDSPSKLSSQRRKERRVSHRLMREFVGLEESLEPSTRRALVEFSFQLTVGNMDEAHRAVKLLKLPKVWENMARMCVKTKRIDVAEICLGHMGHARGARAVREAMGRYKTADGAVDSGVCAAVLAVQLGQMEEAERLYEETGRYDLLNELLQARGEWERALEVAESKDRIHLRCTHYAYARVLEEAGRHEEAIAHFERAGTHRLEVPRMLFDAGKIERLRKYVDSRAEAELQRWWAQYCESAGDFEAAVAYYRKAEDLLAVVRVLCFHKKLEKAAALLGDKEDMPAAFHLARQLEMNGRVKEAVLFYQRAQRFNHAVRLAKEHDMASELTMLALQAPPKLMLEAASYFEGRGMPEKAAALYHKGGSPSKALELCFTHTLFDQLRDIADSLTADADPSVLHRCAEFLLDHGQYAKAVRLFAAASEPGRALDLCVLHNIPIDETLADAMCPPAAQKEGAAQAERLLALQKVAKCCKRQGNYQLACKKYTQAGERVKAMKCLLKSGDTERIVYYAGVSRDRDIYIMAANYLQQLDWRNQPSVLSNISSFYTKAKAFDQLASFYDACAQVEIDEYRDYEKATGALRESVSCMHKARVPSKEQRLAALELKLQHVEAFGNARKLVKTDPQRMLDACAHLLEQRDAEAAVRVGDVYALMVEWHYSQRQMPEAHALIEKMRGRGIILAPYLDSDMVHAVYGAVGMPVAVDPPAAGADAEEAPEEAIEEDVDDD